MSNVRPDPMLTMLSFYDIKQLVVHRIKCVVLYDMPKCTLKGFNLYCYIDSGEFGFKITEKKIKLHALFSHEAVNNFREMRSSEDQTIKEQNNDSVLLTATVLDTHELRWWLKETGKQVEVVKPIRLKNELKIMLDKLICKYCRG